jgi:hypothetical protein
MNSRQAFRSERATWRAIIQLNVVRSIHIILDALAEALAAQAHAHSESAAHTPLSTPGAPPGAYDPRSVYRRSYAETTASSVESTSQHLANANAVFTLAPAAVVVPSVSASSAEPPLIYYQANASSSPSTSAPGASPAYARLTQEHARLRLRLAALLPIEEELKRRLSPTPPPPGPELPSTVVTSNGSGRRHRPRTGNGSNSSRPSTSSSSSGGNGAPAPAPTTTTTLAPLNTNVPLRATREVAVNSALGWKGAINRMLAVDPHASSESVAHADPTNPNDPGRVLSACAEDMRALWADPVVRAILMERRVRLEEMSGL